MKQKILIFLDARVVIGLKPNLKLELKRNRKKYFYCVHSKVTESLQISKFSKERAAFRNTELQKACPSVSRLIRRLPTLVRVRKEGTLRFGFL